MLLVTLEGLPHSGRDAVLHTLRRERPAWTFANTPPDPWSASPAAAWRIWHGLLRKVRAVGAGGKADVLVLSAPWFEHVPRHPAVCKLARAMTAELVTTLTAAAGVKVAAHVMVHLLTPRDESFEQMVCSGATAHNATTLEDLRCEQVRVAQELLDAPTHHPFPCAAFTLPCPPFFDDNEVTLAAIARDVRLLVDAVAQGY